MDGKELDIPVVRKDEDALSQKRSTMPPEKSGGIFVHKE